MGKKLKIKDNIINIMFMSAFSTAIISSASQLGASFFDGLITDQGLGPTALAAVGLAAPCFSIVSFFSACISNGMRAKCTKEMGEGKTNDVNRFFSEAVLLAFGISIVIMLLMLLFPEGWAMLFGATGDAASLAGDVSKYIIGFAIGMPALMLTGVISTAIQIDNGGKLVKKASLISIAVNLTGDILAVVLGFGVLGIALATSVSCYVTVGIMCFHFASQESKLRFRLEKLRKKDFTEMIRLGSDKLVNSAINVLRPVLFNRMVVYFGGSMAMTVLTARNNLSGLCEIPSGGIGIALALTAGFFFGEKNLEDLDKVGKKARKLALEIMLPIGILLVIFAAPIARFYMKGEGEEAISVLTFAIICLAIRMPLGTLNYSRMQFLQSTHQMKAVRQMTILLNFVYILLAALVLGYFFGAYGIMASFPVADGAMLLTNYIKTAVRSHSRKVKPVDYYGLKEGQYVPARDLLEFTLTNREECESYTGLIKDFAAGHSLNDDLIQKLLEVFEMGVNNVYTRAERKSVRNVKIDIRIVSEANDEVSVLFRYPDHIDKYAELTEKSKDISLLRIFATENVTVRIN